jgi:hypothetical protein
MMKEHKFVLSKYECGQSKLTRIVMEKDTGRETGDSKTFLIPSYSNIVQVLFVNDEEREVIILLEDNYQLKVY